MSAWSRDDQKDWAIERGSLMCRRREFCFSDNRLTSWNVHHTAGQGSLGTRLKTETWESLIQRLKNE